MRTVLVRGSDGKVRLEQDPEKARENKIDLSIQQGDLMTDGQIKREGSKEGDESLDFMDKAISRFIDWGRRK